MSKLWHILNILEGYDPVVCPNIGSLQAWDTLRIDTKPPVTIAFCIFQFRQSSGWWRGAAVNPIPEFNLIFITVHCEKWKFRIPGSNEDVKSKSARVARHDRLLTGRQRAVHCTTDRRRTDQWSAEIGKPSLEVAPTTLSLIYSFQSRSAYQSSRRNCFSQFNFHPKKVLFSPVIQNFYLCPWPTNFT